MSRDNARRRQSPCATDLQSILDLSIGPATNRTCCQGRRLAVFAHGIATFFREHDGSSWTRITIARYRYEGSGPTKVVSSKWIAARRGLLMIEVTRIL